MNALTETVPPPVLEVEDLRVTIPTAAGDVHAVDGLNLKVAAGETVAVLGESGCGKSATARAIKGLSSGRNARVSGTVRLKGVDLASLSRAEQRRVRGSGIGMVFQDALSALNPVLSVGNQIIEAYRVQGRCSRAEAERRAAASLESVGIPDARRRLKDYPHQFSGGMRQRVMIAMALAQDPDVLIADEPTTALDVTVQAQIMELLREIQVERQMAMVLITHDMGVVADVADRVMVMYAGRLAETADALTAYTHPAHPYTRALLESVPRPTQVRESLTVIPGSPPDLTALPAGCAYAPRCSFATDECAQRPPEYEVGKGHRSACHHWEEVIAHGPS